MLKHTQTLVSAHDTEGPEVVTYLPTIMSSHSEARDLKVFHRSMVKMVLALLKMEVSEDMRAAIITAIIKPRSPGRKDARSSEKTLCLIRIKHRAGNEARQQKTCLTCRKQLHDQFGISSI